MENQLAEVLQTFKEIIETNKQEAITELELCDTLEKCYAWKRKYLGKESIINQSLKAINDRSTSN